MTERTTPVIPDLLATCEGALGAAEALLAAAREAVDDGHVERFLRTKEGKRFSNWGVEKVLYSPSFTPELRGDLEGRGYQCLDLTDFADVLRVS